MPDERAIADCERSELIARRFPTFAVGWVTVLAIWLVAFVLEGRLGWTVLDLVAAAVVGLAVGGSLVRAEPAAPRVLPIALATCIGLGLVAIGLVEAVDGYMEVLAFLLLTLYVLAALLFAWGWRAELALLAATLLPWVLRLGDLRRFVPLPELAAAVAIGGGLALGVAEGGTRSLRQVSRRRRAQHAATVALEASRDAYRDLAEQAPDLIWTADLTGRLTYVNPPLARFLGTKAEALIGRSIAGALTSNPENPDFVKTYASILAGESLPPTAIECPTPRGPRWVEVTATLMRDAAGTAIGVRGISRDVHERRTSETALRASEERFHSAFDNAGVGMAVVGLDGKPVEVNGTFAEMLGYAPHELLTRTMDSLAHPDDVARATIETMRLVMGETRAFHMEKRYLHRDGHVVRGLLTCSLVRDALGRPQSLIAQVQDIGERKAAEEALQRSEARYRGLVESQLEMVVRLDAGGRFTFVNEAYAATFGATREAPIGTPFMEHVHADDRATVARAIRNIQQPPHRVLVEIRNLTVRGVRWISWEGGVVVDASGHVLEVQAVGRDVTERRLAENALRESEARFRSAFEDAGIGMGISTTGGIVVRANTAFETMLGYGPGELVGRSLYDLVHADDRASLADNQARLRSGETGVYQSERRYLRHDGSIVWTVATASLVSDPGGGPSQIIGQLQDITERRLAEDALRRTLEAIRQSEDQLRRLARQQASIREEERKRVAFDLHDDVCQELIGVGILLEALRRKVGPMSVEHAQEFDRIVRYLGEVVEHLRKLARELRPFTLRDLGLDGSLRSLATGMTSPTTTVTADVATEIPRLDEETELTVYRIAQEALTNAVRHAGAHAIAIRLVVVEGVLVLDVRDDGCGFDPGARSAAALGLASMEERALALGGRLEVCSTPGAGTTITLTWPLDAERAARVRELAGSSPTRSSSRPSTTTTPRAAARD